jgi:chemotaxis protein methyltransferase CheR
MSSVYEREFEFNRKDFEYIRKLVGERTGIVLSDHKITMVYGRLSRRLRQLKLRSFKEYLALLEDESADELVEFTNAITTNLTSFFREPHHFEYLKAEAIPALLKQRLNKRLRLWSAGCSTGEEPYSISMALHECMESQIRNWDVKILATDLDTNVVQKGKNGVYEQERVNGIEDKRLRKWFRRGRDTNAGKVIVADSIRSLITFKQLNLLHEWPMKGPFDIIFCRNVVIYFGKDTQRELFNRYAELLADDGYLFIGHSESLHKVTDRFKLIGKTVYRKVR